MIVEGDSGGPAIDYHNNTAYLAGIVSFGPKSCGQAAIPSVYTRISYYIDWIEKVVNTLWSEKIIKTNDQWN